MKPVSLISSLFSQSPLRPIQKHMDKVHSCVSQLLPFILEVIAQNWTEASNIQQNISQLEQEADKIKREVRRHLPSNLFLPVSRGDLLDILRLQDRIANQARDIAGIILGRKMEIPAFMQAMYQQFLTRCLDACTQARKAILELDELLEVGFQGREVKLVENMISELDTIEQDTDEQQIKIRHTLFTHEKELSPVDVMFIYQIIYDTGNLANQAQNVGEQLQLLVAS